MSDDLISDICDELCSLDMYQRTLLAGAMSEIERLTDLATKQAELKRKYRKEASELSAEVRQRDRAIQQVHDLMAESSGVTGLHLNGDVAEWGWLVENEWLSELASAADKQCNHVPWLDRSQTVGTTLRCRYCKEIIPADKGPSDDGS